MNPTRTIDREKLLKCVRSGLCIATFMAVGCGPAPPKLYPVSGNVTFESKPLPSGEIIFEPEDRKMPANGGPIKNGKYSIKTVAGKYQVKINAAREIPGKTTQGAMGEAIPATESYLPEKYNSETELTTAVYPNDTNTINFDLTP